MFRLFRRLRENIEGLKEERDSLRRQLKTVCRFRDEYQQELSKTLDLLNTANKERDELKEEIRKTSEYLTAVSATLLEIAKGWHDPD